MAKVLQKCPLVLCLCSTATSLVVVYRNNWGNFVDKTFLFDLSPLLVPQTNEP